MNESTSLKGASAESLVAEVVDEFTERLNRGEQPSADEYVNRYPQIAATLRQVFQALLLVRTPAIDPVSGATPSAEPSPVSGVLGDFRILGEIGQGGMGVVYEAEQISLGRRVALKVLPFAAVLDERRLQRFQNEARAAALLKHPNIVSVYSVGCERGVHYYAMEYVEGHTLAEVIAGLRPKGEGGRRTGEGGRRKGEGRMKLRNRGLRRPPSAVRLHPTPSLSRSFPPKGRSTARSSSGPSPGWESRRPTRWNTPMGWA